MGTGSTTKSDWEDVAGSDVFVDTNNFAGIKTVYFEVSMHIPTKNGTMTARLFNVTDKHPVWYSDASTDQDTSTFVASKITLDPGNKQYRVQLKTSLQYPSLLDSARIKILTQ
jgi:cation transport regulator ChaC